MEKGRKINLIFVLWFLKIIFDLFYQYKILNIILTGFATLLLISSMSKRKIVFNRADYCIIALSILFTISFLKSPTYYIDYFKIISAFVLYFLGRFNYESEKNSYEALRNALLIALLINFFICISGYGTVKWGNALTYRGLYYFKTDLACSISFFLVFWLINTKKVKHKLLFILTILISYLLIFFANARIYYLIGILILIISILYKNKKFISKKIKIISFKNIVKILLIGVLTIFAIGSLSKLSLFNGRQMISLEFNNLSDLFNSSNTQGRNIIWQTLLTNFNNQSFFTKLFGAALSFTSKYGYEGFNEHNLYLKLLINTGYVGCIIFIIFIFLIVKNIKIETNRRVSYISLLLMIVFIIGGISVPTILYTNCSWIPMFYFGVCVSLNQYETNYILANDINILKE